MNWSILGTPGNYNQFFMDARWFLCSSQTFGAQHNAESSANSGLKRGLLGRGPWFFQSTYGWWTLRMSQSNSRIWQPAMLPPFTTFHHLSPPFTTVFAMNIWTLAIWIPKIWLRQNGHSTRTSLKWLQVPSGKQTKSYWQCPFIVSFPIKKCEFP